MSSRDQILNAVKANRPPFTPLPENINFSAPAVTERLPLFIKSFESAGGLVYQVLDKASIGPYLENQFQSPARILNTIKEVNFGYSLPENAGKGHILANLEIAVVSGTLGVAENGAIWVSEDDLPTRVIPFICEHLVLVLPENKLVGTMHEAYAQLQVAKTGYGVFIAGPSRTADIEQSLVIGAHGPKRAQVFLVEDAG